MSTPRWRYRACAAIQARKVELSAAKFPRNQARRLFQLRAPGTTWTAPNRDQPACNHGPANEEVWKPKDRLVPGESGSFSADTYRYRTEPHQEHKEWRTAHDQLDDEPRQGLA